ncbi:MAG TPA: hypothetical protein VFV72_13730 [Candidatus Limnocylindrales bacterium]|nr:hypothetical protein [Candidatus Limnocylindrales bacterium]
MNETAAAPAARLGFALSLVVALTLTLAACSSAGASAPPPSASAAPSQPASEQPLPSDPDGSVVSPSDPAPGGGGGIGDGTLVVPRPGTINPHPVSVEKIEPAIDGRHVTVKLTWTSGVEPCYQLDSVIVSPDGNDVALTVLEGSGQADVMCVEIAKQKSTIVDLGELQPGDYTISATNSDIPPVTITVS